MHSQRSGWSLSFRGIVTLLVGMTGNFFTQRLQPEFSLVLAQLPLESGPNPSYTNDTTVSTSFDSESTKLFDDFFLYYDDTFGNADPSTPLTSDPEATFKKEILPKIHIPTLVRDFSVQNLTVHLWLPTMFVNYVDLASALIEHNVPLESPSNNHVPPLLIAKAYERHKILDLLGIPSTQHSLSLDEAHTLISYAHWRLAMIIANNDLSFDIKRKYLDFYWHKFKVARLLKLFQKAKEDQAIYSLVAKTAVDYDLNEWLDVLFPNNFSDLEKDNELIYVFSYVLAKAHYAQKLDTLHYLLDQKYDRQLFTPQLANKALLYTTYMQLRVLEQLEQPDDSIISFNESLALTEYLLTRLHASPNFKPAGNTQSRSLKTSSYALLTSALPGPMQRYSVAEQNTAILHHLLKMHLDADAYITQNDLDAIIAINNTTDEIAKELIRNVSNSRLSTVIASVSFFLNFSFYHPLCTIAIYSLTVLTPWLFWVALQECTYDTPVFITRLYNPIRLISFHGEDLSHIKGRFLTFIVYFLLTLNIMRKYKFFLDRTDPLTSSSVNLLAFLFLISMTITIVPWTNYTSFRYAYRLALSSLKALRVDTHEPSWEIPLYQKTPIPPRYLSYDLQFCRPLSTEEIIADVLPEEIQKHYQKLVPTAYSHHVTVKIIDQQIILTISKLAITQRYVEHSLALGQTHQSLIDYSNLPPSKLWLSMIQKVCLPPLLWFNYVFDHHAAELPPLAAPIGPFTPTRKNMGIAPPTSIPEPTSNAIQILEDRLRQFRDQKDFSKVFVSFADALAKVASAPEEDEHLQPLRPKVALAYLESIYRLASADFIDQAYIETCLEIAARMNGDAPLTSELIVLIQLKAKLAQKAELPLIFEDFTRLETLDSIVVKTAKPDLQQMLADRCVDEAEALFKQHPINDSAIANLLNEAQRHAVRSNVKLNDFLVKIIKHYCTKLQTMMDKLPLLAPLPKEVLDLQNQISAYFDIAPPLEKQKVQSALKAHDNLLTDRTRKLARRREKITDLAAKTRFLGQNLRTEDSNLSLFHDELTKSYQETLSIKRQLWGDITLPEFNAPYCFDLGDWDLIEKIQFIIDTKAKIDNLIEHKLTLLESYLEQLDSLLQESEMAVDVAWSLLKSIEKSKQYLGALVPDELEQQSKVLQTKLAASATTPIENAVISAKPIHFSGASASCTEKAMPLEDTPNLASRILLRAHQELCEFVESSNSDASEQMRASLHLALIRWFEALLSTDLIAAARTYASNMRNYLAHPQGIFDFAKLQILANFIINRDLAYCKDHEDRPRIRDGLAAIFAHEHFLDFVPIPTDLDPVTPFIHLLKSLTDSAQDIFKLTYDQSPPSQMSIAAAGYAVLHWFEVFTNSHHDALHAHFSTDFSKLQYYFRKARNQLAHEPRLKLSEITPAITRIARSKHFATLVARLSTMAGEFSKNPHLFYSLTDHEEAAASVSTHASSAVVFVEKHGIVSARVRVPNPN